MKKILAIVLSAVVALGITVPVLAGVGTDWLYELFDYGNGTTYYVDSVSGNDENSGKSEEEAWKTLEKVNSIPLSGGDKVLFKSGCTFIGQLMPQGSGNAEDGVIRFAGYGEGAQPIINANGTLENEGAVIRLYNQEYIEIDGLELTNNSSVPGIRYGVYVVAEDYGVADHIYITNCNIHDVPTNTRKENLIAMVPNGGQGDYLAENGPGYGGIIFASLRGGAMIPTAFNDILIDNNKISKTGTNGTGIGITNEWHMFVGKQDSVMQEGYLNLSPFFGSTNILVSNNDLKNTAAAIRFDGVDGRVGNGVVAEYNVSYKPDNCDSNSAMWANNSYNIVWQYNEIYGLDNGGMNDCGAFDADGYSENTLFQYNYTHDNRGEPIMFCNVGWREDYDYINTIGSVYRYNISQNDMWGANEGHGRFWVQKGAKNNWFYNNVIYVGEGIGGRNISIADTWENHIYNNVFINLSDKTSYYIEVPDETLVLNNCFYGYHPASEPSGDPSNIILGLDDPMPLSAPGTGKVGIDTLQGYMLTDDSPLKGAGKVIADNGSRDFFGNCVKADKAPDIGAHQSGSFEDTKAPSAAGEVTAKVNSYDSITLSWKPAEDNVKVERYVVYVNGEPSGRTSSTEWTAKELSENTEYSFFVRAFDAAGYSSDSQTVTASTKRATSDETRLHISGAQVYDGHGKVSSSFKGAELVAPRFKVVDANGRPIENARVEVLVSAESQNDYKTVTDMTDKNGIAQTGFYSDSYRGENTVIEVKVKGIYKDGYSYDASNKANISSIKFNVKGADSSYYANLVRNSEFDNVYKGTTIPVSWGVASGGGLDAVRVASGADMNGGNALEFSEAESFTAVAIQNYTNLPNGVYTLTYYVKNTATGASITLSGYGDSTTEPIPVSPKWQQVAFSDIDVTTGKISLQIDVSGDASTITYIDKVELSQNLATNTLYKYVHPYSKLPSDHYYKTDKGTIGEDGSNVTELIDNASVKAVKIKPHYSVLYNNALVIGSDEAFNVTLGQTLKNIAKDKYTLKVDAINTGGIKAYIVVKEYGGKEKVAEIPMSSGMKSTKINGIEVTSGTAVIELRFEGDGDPEEQIIIQGLSFSARSDYPTVAAAITFAGDNLLASQNPSFENDSRTTVSIPSSWLNTWDSGKISCIATDETAHSGNYSCKVTLHHDQQKYNTGGTKTTSLNLKPNSHTFTGLATGYYTLSMWAKGNYRVKLSVTANGNVGYEKYSTVSDEWHKVEVKDVLVTNGQLSISVYSAMYEKDEFIEYYAFMDDFELYLQKEYLSNKDFESGALNGWEIADNKGYGEVKTTSVAQSGSKAARIVLPGTPSEVAFASTALLNNMQAGTYNFSAWVKGTSVIEMYVEADGKEAVVSRAQADDTWQNITMSAVINDSIQELGVRVINPENTTSSYVTVDNASLTRKITAADVATTIGDLKPVRAGETSIMMPTVRDGFTLTLIETSEQSVIDLMGRVKTPAKDTTVLLTFKIVNNSEPSDVRYVTSAVKVLAYRQEEDDDKDNNKPIIENTVKDDNKPLPDVQDTDVSDKTDIPDNEDTIIDITANAAVNEIGFTFSWLVFAMFILAVISVLGFTFTVMLAMKKKAEENKAEYI